MPDTNIIVDLVKLGFHGVAIVIFIFGFRLMSQAINSKSDDQTDGNGKAEQLGMKITAARFFVMTSLAFLVLGLGFELVRMVAFKEVQHNVTLMVSPSDVPPDLQSLGVKLPIFKHGLKEVTMLDGQAELPVRERDHFIFTYEELLSVIRRLSTTSVECQDRGRTSDEIGFDDA